METFSNLYETSIHSPIIVKSLSGRRAMAVLHLGGPPLVNSQSAHLSSSSSPLFNPQIEFLRLSSTRFPPRGVKSAAMVEPRFSSSDMTGTRGGQIQRQVLSNAQRTKLNPSSDRSFYSSPRLVTHVDDQFLNTLTDVYRERIPENAEVLDLMSSWVSHLPAERKYKRVVGHGLNAQELSRNRRLDHFFVKDLNAEPKLECADSTFDAVLCTVSVQYLEQPEKIFAEIYRILRPGGVCIVSFSNRMFYDKAVAAWREGSEYSRTQLVVQYFQCVAGFTQPEVIKKSPQASTSQQLSGNPLTSWFSNLFKSVGRDPFYAVIAFRNFKPTKE